MRHLWMAALLGMFACADSDDDKSTDTDDTEETDDTTEETDTETASYDITGMWVSEGADVAPVLAGPPGNVVSIDADFEAGGAYTVDAEDNAGTVTTFTGTYVVDDTTDPHGITLTQTAPYDATVEGVFSVDDDGVMSYDALQTSPDLGFAPATAAGGVGSSGLGATNVQTYRR